MPARRRERFSPAFGWIRGKVGSVIDWVMAKIRAVKTMLSGIMGGSSGGAGDTPGFAGGGRVRGPGSATSDSILARLSTGEFVIHARAVQHYGAGLFEAAERDPHAADARPRLRRRRAGPARAADSGGSGGSFATVNLTIGGEVFGGLMAPRETAERLIRFATAEEQKKAGRRPAWFEGG